MSIFADEFADMMPSTITVQSIVGRNDTGQAQYSSPHTYPARINTQTRNVIGANGQEVVARGRAWLDTIDPLTVNDLFTFPDGSHPIVLVVNQVPDETGPAYTSIDWQ